MTARISVKRPCCSRRHCGLSGLAGNRPKDPRRSPAGGPLPPQRGPGTCRRPERRRVRFPVARGLQVNATEAQARLFGGGIGGVRQLVRLRVRGAERRFAHREKRQRHDQRDDERDREHRDEQRRSAFSAGSLCKTPHGASGPRFSGVTSTVAPMGGAPREPARTVMTTRTRRMRSRSASYARPAAPHPGPSASIVIDSLAGDGPASGVSRGTGGAPGVNAHDVAGLRARAAFAGPLRHRRKGQCRESLSDRHRRLFAVAAHQSHVRWIRPIQKLRSLDDRFNDGGRLMVFREHTLRFPRRNPAALASSTVNKS